MAQLLAHYMCWHTDGAERYRIGQDKHDYRYNHWKWEQNPDAHQPDRVRSWYHPLTPFYDSSNEKVIADHITLLQDAGIHGIVIDWLGHGKIDSDEIHDLGIIHRAAEAVAKQARERSYPFAICFDCNCKDSLEKNGVDKPTYLKESLLKFVRAFRPSNRGYLCGVSATPLLFVFGNPDDLATDDEWKDALSSAMNGRKLLVVMQWGFHNTRSWANGAFLWPTVKRSKVDRVKKWSTTEKELASQYQELTKLKKDGGNGVVAVGLAFPGLEDIYLADEQPQRHFEIVQRRAGRTLRDTLDLGGKQESLDYIQIVTFNDWNEGTQIEPAVEYAHRELDSVKNFAQQDCSS